MNNQNPKKSKKLISSDPSGSQGFREKRQRTRAKVRLQLKSLHRRLQELELDQQRGARNKADRESCRGEIEVLKKELQSIGEGGHTTFLAAKKMLDPKKDISSKTRKLQTRRVMLNRTISKLELKLTEPELSSEKRRDVLAKLAKFKDERVDLAQEKQALKEYNHTRFLEHRKETEATNEQEKELREINDKIIASETSLAAAQETGDATLVHEAREALHLLQMEKESIENFSHDLFLKNLEQLKAQRDSDLD